MSYLGYLCAIRDCSSFFGGHFDPCHSDEIREARIRKSSSPASGWSCFLNSSAAPASSEGSKCRWASRRGVASSLWAHWNSRTCYAIGCCWCLIAGIGCRPPPDRLLLCRGCLCRRGRMSWLWVFWSFGWGKNPGNNETLSKIMRRGRPYWLDGGCSVMRHCASGLASSASLACAGSFGAAGAEIQRWFLQVGGRWSIEFGG